MERNWIDFKAIKNAATIEHVLARYGVKLKRSGKELRGKCPIHLGEGTDAFHANTEKNAFHCFSCGAKGNVLDLVAAMEKCSVRDAGIKIRDWFAIPAGESSETQKASAPTGSERAKEEAGQEDAPNKPLGFRLQGIDHHHPYLAGRGVDPETAEYFGIGYFSGKGTMHGRIVIPIENERGELVAYAGRSIDGTEPKYKLPAGFKKSQVLYNLVRAAEETDGTAVLVEGFFDCIRVTQAEYPSVALMGCSMSEEQEAQLGVNFRRVMIMLDGDEAGQRAAPEIARRLARRTWVRIVEPAQGKQPDQLSALELRGLFQAT